MPKRKTDWKKALRVLADAIEEHTSIPNGDDFCNYCPAGKWCNSVTCWEEGNCRRVITKWAKETF
jgi:hypothetical protein